MELHAEIKMLIDLQILTYIQREKKKVLFFLKKTKDTQSTQL